MFTNVVTDKYKGYVIYRERQYFRISYTNRPNGKRAVYHDLLDERVSVKNRSRSIVDSMIALGLLPWDPKLPKRITIL